MTNKHTPNRFSWQWLQRNVRGRVKDTARGEAIHFDFAFGPLKFACVVNLPEGEEDEGDVYVKVGFEPSEFWHRDNEKEEPGVWFERGKNTFPIGPCEIDIGEQSIGARLRPNDLWRPYIRSEDKKR